MPYKSLSQTSFFTPEFADPGCLPEGSVGWVLRVHADILFPVWLFGLWHGAGRRGRSAWPASVLLTALILGSREGIAHRRAIVRRLKRDTSWRAACGLDIGGETPDEATFRRFERYLQRRDPASGTPRELLLHEHLVRVCLNEGVVNRQHANWVFDSTPMWCFGAVHGTFRLLGDGLRGLGLRWARLTGKTVQELATSWELPLLLAKSTKGAFRISWRDATARAKATDDLVRSVLAAIGRVRGNLDKVRANKRKGLLRRCRSLAKVIADDLETDEDGRLVVARRVAAGRLVAITDEQARSSRKSKSQAYKGFKIHLLGDSASGLIASLCVTPANVGDNKVAHRLIRRARDLHSEIIQVLGDTAYAAAELRLKARRLEGVDVLAPPQPIARKPGRFSMGDFNINLAAGEATCPGGVTVPLKQGRSSRYFSWSTSVCESCPLRSHCVSERTPSKTISIHRHHDEVQDIRSRWEDPAIREQYRRRTEGERLINEQVRRGCRHARAWGLKAATTQAYIAAMGVNLALLARTFAGRLQQAA